MKQVLLSGKGEVGVFDVPLPAGMPNALLVRNAFSLISTGTEGSAVSRRGGWLGMIEKACGSSQRVAKAWKLVRAQGMQQALQTVQATLDDWRAIGYSSCGQVVETDGDTRGIAPGDWVACMGTGLANHAEYVVAPANLAAKLPVGVEPDEAAFGAVACVAQHAVRNLERSAGETVLVVGLGLIGSLAAMTARAMGYQVLGLDLSRERAEFCTQQLGVDAYSDPGELASAVRRATGDQGVDGVVLAAATTSSEPIHLACDLCRPRGAVSVVGDVGMSLDRQRMYRKELSVRVSCSYGPGRYDDAYELAGHDYPIGHVRWTQQRVLEFYLQCLADRRMNVRPLISHRFPVAQATAAYACLKQTDAGVRTVLLQYDATETVVEAPRRDARTIRLTSPTHVVGHDVVRLGLIGCGGFASRVHLPNLKRLANLFQVGAVCSRSGVSAAVAARRFGIPIATSDVEAVLQNDAIDAVLISTRHASHAALVLRALCAGKHVFVEKPLCLTPGEGDQIVSEARGRGLTVRVGLNRRFAPLLNWMRDAVGTGGPRLLTCRVNVNRDQLNHWSNTAEEGGRFLGEGVHFLDLCNWFIGATATSLTATCVGEPSAANPNLCVQISYADGSVGNVIYTVNGHAGLGKEYYEAHGNGRSACCDDFKSLTIHGGRQRSRRRDRHDKGHVEQLREFYQALCGEECGQGADAVAGALATSMACDALQSARERTHVSLVSDPISQSVPCAA